jgi:hypothetical protein
MKGDAIEKEEKKTKTKKTSPETQEQVWVTRSLV